MVLDVVLPPAPPDEETTLADEEAQAAIRELELRSAFVTAEADAQAIAGHLGELRAKVQTLAGQAPEGSALARLCARIDGVRLPYLDPALQRLGLDTRRAALVARYEALAAAAAQLEAFRDDATKLYAQIAVGSTAVDAYAKRLTATDVAPSADPDQAAANDAPATAPERLGTREHPRVPLEVAVTFDSRNNFYVGFARDISRGGVFVATDASLPQGTPVNLELALPDGKVLSVAGEVRWCRQYDRNVPEMIPGIGIRFTGLSTEALASIESFVSTRVPLMIA